MRKFILILILVLFSFTPLRAGDSLGYFFIELDYLLADNNYAHDTTSKIWVINSACRMLTSLVSHYAPCVVETTTVSIQEDTIRYYMPAGFYELLSARQLEGDRPAMEYVPAWDWNKEEAVTGYVSKLSKIGNYIEVSPVPTADDEIFIYYNAQPNQLSDMGDTTLIRREYSPVISWFAHGYCMKREERIGDAQHSFDFGATLLNAIVSSLANEKYSRMFKPKVLEGD